MELRVQSAVGGEAVHGVVELELDDTLAGVYQKVAAMLGLTPKTFDLTVRGEVLSDCDTMPLCDSDMTAEDEVIVCVGAEYKRRLLQKRIDKLCVGRSKAAVLSAAAASDDAEIVQLFLASGHQPSADVAGRTLLAVAARHGSLSVMRLLMEAETPVTDGVLRLLPRVVRKGMAEMAAVLLGLGADPTRGALLSLAVESGSLATVDVVIGTGKGDFRRANPLQKAVQSGRVAIARRLVDCGAPVSEDLLHEAAGYRGAEGVALCRVLVDAGASLCWRRSDGATALHCVVTPCAAEYLVEQGADTSATHRGCVPLVTAAAAGRAEVVRVLASCSPDSSLLQALVAAGEAGEIGVAALLLELGAQCDAAAADRLLHSPAMLHPIAEHITMKCSTVDTEKNGMSPLRTTLRTGTCTVRTLQVLLDAGCHPHPNELLLHVAVQGALSCEVLRKLMVAGCSPNMISPSGESPLDIAIRKYQHSPAMLFELLRAGASLHTGLPGKLHAAVKWRVPVQELLKRGAAVNETCNGKTALHVAANCCNTDAAAVLVAAGADIDAMTTDGKTPLVLAVPHPRMVQLLLSLGADAGLGKIPPLRKVMECRRYTAAVAVMLSAAPTGPSFTDPSMWEENGIRELSVAHALLELQEYDPDTRITPDHETALHAAYKDIDYWFIPRALDRCNPALRNDRGNTPLHVCLLNKLNSLKEVSTLSEAMGPAHIDIRNNRGETPLHLAMYQSCTEIAHVLLASGADLLARDDAGWTTLHHLVHSKGAASYVSELLALGTDVHALSVTGETPLTLAIAAGRVDVVKVLLEAGADVNRTALHQAVVQGMRDVAEVLIPCCAAVDSTILATAMEGEHIGVAELLLFRFPGIVAAADALLFSVRNDLCAVAKHILRGPRPLNLSGVLVEQLKLCASPAMLRVLNKYAGIPISPKTKRLQRGRSCRRRLLSSDSL